MPTLETEPAEFTAGDSISWTKSLADYPAPTWVLTYTLRRSADLHTFTAVAVAPDHLVVELPAATTLIKPGTYQWVAQVTDGTDRETVGRGSVRIRPDPSDAKTDHRTHNQKVLEAILDVMLGKAEHDLSQFGIRSRSGSRLSWEELEFNKRHYQQLVAEELGKRPGRAQLMFR